MAFGSQVKLLLVLALPTALVIFALLLAFQLAGAPISSSGRYYSAPILAVVGLILALTTAAIQVAALGLIRLIPWRGPSLKIEGDDHLTRVFE